MGNIGELSYFPTPSERLYFLLEMQKMRKDKQEINEQIIELINGNINQLSVEDIIVAINQISFNLTMLSTNNGYLFTSEIWMESDADRVYANSETMFDPIDFLPTIKQALQQYVKRMTK